jgi:hypothetical protein
LRQKEVPGSGLLELRALKGKKIPREDVRSEHRVVADLMGAAGELVDEVLEGESKAMSGVQAMWVKPQGRLLRGKRQGR